MGIPKKQPAKLASTEQILDLQYQFGVAFRKLPEARVKAILKDKKLLHQLVQKAAKELQIPMQSERAISAIPMLEEYYKKVYGLDIPEIAEMEFPEHDYLHAFMTVSPKHNEDEIMEAQKKYFHRKNGIVNATDEYSQINIYRYKNPVAKNINRDEENRIQSRPSGLYVFSHSNEDEPDQKHRGKSYDDAVTEKMLFERCKEYQLVTGFKKFTQGYFMDKKGWTRTSSLWSDGDLVSGGWFDGDEGLCIDLGYRYDGFPDDGPRELFL